MLDASTRRITLLIIFLVKCFNKQTEFIRFLNFCIKMIRGICSSSGGGGGGGSFAQMDFFNFECSP